MCVPEAKLIYKQESRLLEWKGIDISEGIEVAHFIDDLQVCAHLYIYIYIYMFIHVCI